MKAVDRVLRSAERAFGAFAKRAERQRTSRRLGSLPPRIGDKLRDGHVGGWRDASCAFALSTGRAGSQTLSALWALSPTVLARHEPLPRLIQTSHAAWCDDPYDPAWRNAVWAARDDLVADGWRRDLVYAETNNRLTSLAPALAACFPASRFVHIWRHPYEFIRSAMARGYYQGHHWDFARFVPRSEDPARHSWRLMEPAEKIAWLWAATNAFVLDWSDSATSPIHRIDSARLFDGDAESIAAVYAAVGAPIPPRRQVQRVLNRRLNAEAYDRNSGEAWSAGLRDRIDAHVESVAAKLGLDL